MSYAAETWNMVREQLSNNLSQTTMQTWFDEVEAVDFNGNLLLLSCANDFKRNMVESHFLGGIKDALQSLFSKELEVRVMSADEKTSYPGKRTKPAQTVRSKYTFDSFVVGKSNELAFATARAVSEHIGKRYNPLLLYGSSGLGKTHLMQAVVNELTAKDGRIHIVNTSGNMLTNDLVQAIRTKTTDEMRQTYLGADLLVVDDIQFIAGKQQTQEEFFNTFNTLYSTGCQIILASDRPPREMQQLDERLRTRFEGGMMADITRPDYETRLAIIQKLASEQNVYLKDGACEQIAEVVSDNVRQLEGVVAKLGAIQAISPHPISDNELYKVLGGFVESKPATTVDDIIMEVSRFYGIKASDILGRSRTQSITTARNVCIYLAAELLGLTTAEIGRKFSRDHATILHSQRKVSETVSKDPEFSARVSDLASNIEATHRL